MAVAAGSPAAGRLPLKTVASSDGVAVAVHELAGSAHQSALLVSHATGFHGRCYQGLSGILGEQFRVVGFDHRGHGATPAPDWWQGEHVNWLAYADDAGAVARHVAPDAGLLGFGHSMGASTLLISAAREPELFRRLVLFEPIAGVFDFSDIHDAAEIPIVASALRRRRRFTSHDEAYANFASKPPLSLMSPADLRAYVDFGLRPTPDGDVELCCDPEVEAATFAASRVNGVWSLLPSIEVPTLVVSGAIDVREPSAWAAAIASRLPNGDLAVLPHLTHFGPFSHPGEVAALV